MSETIFTTETPQNGDKNDGASYTLATLFQTSSNGVISGVRWYFPTTLPTGTVHAALLAYVDDATAGATLATADFVSPTAGTWNTATFSGGAAITAGAKYYAAIQTNDHYVSSDVNQWTPITGAHLSMPADDTVTPQRNGRFFPFSGTTVLYPTGGVGDLYYVDVVFDVSVVPVSVTDGTPPVRPLSAHDVGSAGVGTLDAAFTARPLSAANTLSVGSSATDAHLALRALTAADSGTAGAGIADAAATMRVLRPADTVSAGVSATDSMATARVLSAVDSISAGVIVADVGAPVRALAAADAVSVGVAATDIVAAAVRTLAAADTISAGATFADTAGWIRALTSGDQVAYGIGFLDRLGFARILTSADIVTTTMPGTLARRTSRLRAGVIESPLAASTSSARLTIGT